MGEVIGLPDEINGRDVEFYQSHPGIDATAKAYFLGNFTISDDKATFAMLDSLDTDNTEVRPFYYYLFVKLMEQSDGALSEAVGLYGQLYAAKYPHEFYSNFEKSFYKESYENWVGYIGYEILMAMEPREALEKFINKQKDNCVDCSSAILDSIEKFKREIELFLKENE